MAFTYVGTLASTRDRVRFAIGDTVEDAGPRPSDANFSDAEIDGLLSNESSWQMAVAAAFEALAAEWTRHVSFNADGMSAEQSDVAAGFRAQAADWRARNRYAVGSRSVTRADGYSDDEDNVT